MDQLSEERKTQLVANWVFIGIGMLLVQVLLGGITRLTGSGLSITEWKPIMGALPPMNELEWQQSFDKYQQIAQYKYLNTHFTLSDFKFIFFWEWFHRQWARLIGVVFLIPFLFFLAKGYFKKWMINPLIILFLLGAMQGAIGWVMVKSGLNENDLYVSHIKLAIHFISAMVLICYALVFGLSIKVKAQDKIVSPSLKNFAVLLIALLTIQLFYGAFMAGLKAASAASTWPTINGKWVPDFMGNVFHDRITIHFIHRNLAYLLVVLVIVWWAKAKKTSASLLFAKAKNWPLLLVFLQVLLGIASVLLSPHIKLGSFGIFEWMALFHQLTGMLLLLSLVGNLYLIKQRVS